MIGILGIPPSSHRGDHIVGIKRRAVMELDTKAQFERPLGQVSASFVAFGQRRLDLRRADLEAQRGFVDLRAGSERRTVLYAECRRSFLSARDDHFTRSYLREYEKKIIDLEAYLFKIWLRD